MKLSSQAIVHTSGLTNWLLHSYIFDTVTFTWDKEVLASDMKGNVAATFLKLYVLLFASTQPMCNDPFQEIHYSSLSSPTCSFKLVKNIIKRVYSLNLYTSDTWSTGKYCMIGNWTASYKIQTLFLFNRCPQMRNWGIANDWKEPTCEGH